MRDIKMKYFRRSIMKEINLIKKDTIIPKVKPLDWDVEIKGRPYYVVRL